MIKKFVCTEEIHLPKCDDDGFATDDVFIVDVGTVWNLVENDAYRFIGGEVRLENDTLGWIETTGEHFKECFEEVKK